MERENPGTINALLDVTRFSGEPSGRMMPTILFIASIGLPVMGYLYLLLGIVPIWLFLVVFIPYAIRMGLLTIGDEVNRLNQFKRQLYDVFSATTDLMDVKLIHENGMIEYTNNNVAFNLVAYNRDQSNQEKRALAISNIIRGFGSYIFDIRVYNVEMEDELQRRYDGVKFFAGDPEAASDFLKVIDFNREYAKNNSLVSMTVFTVYGRLHEWHTLYSVCESAVKSAEAKVFRKFEIADKEKVMKIMNEDMDTYIDLEEMQIQKYADGNYYGSKVLGYNLVEGENKTEEEKDFMEGGFLVE